MNLPGLTRKTIDQRPTPPGQHGSARRRRPSDFAMQLLEKQKLRFNYGVSERQLRRLYAEAARGKGVTGDNLLSLLERRLDNIVFRAGFAPTIPAARQLVCHGHIRVNDRRVDIPSYRVRADETIGTRDRAGIKKLVVESLAHPSLPDVDWLEVDKEAQRATVLVLPTAAAVPFDIDVQMVVEFYAR